MAGERHKALLAGGLIQTLQYGYLARSRFSHKALLAGGLIQTWAGVGLIMWTLVSQSPFSGRSDSDALYEASLTLRRAVTKPF